MATVAFATLDLIPSLKGLQSSIEKQSRGPLSAAGRSGGRLFGESAGKEAGSKFSTLFERGTQSSFSSVGKVGGQTFGASAGTHAADNFAGIFQAAIRTPIVSAGQSGGYDFGTAAGSSASGSFAETFQGGLEGSDLLAGAGLADVFQDAIADVGEVGEEAGGEFADGAADGLGKLQGLLAGAGVVGIFKDLVDQGSAAEQSVGGVRAVFGDFAAEIEINSARAAQALGLSSTAYQELVTVTGALLKNKGLEDYATQANTLIQTGADLAAQFGGSTAEAVGALNSALRGESDPIERYAISLNETAVNARLAATGQDKLTGAALDQAKITARLAIVAEQSADAMGAFGREADTQAGKSARATAAWEDMRAELGAKLLPATAAFTGFLNDEALPALERLGRVAADAARFVGSLPAPVQTAATAFVALRVAALAGLGTLAAGSVAALSSAFLTLRLRVMFAGDAFVAARAQGSLMAASFAGIRAGALGAAVAMGTLARAIAPIAVVTAGITLFGKFASAQEAVAERERETKARVDELTDSLDKQTGALTDATRAAVVDELFNTGALQAARDLGLSLDTVTEAALGNEAALAKLPSRMEILVKRGEELSESDKRRADAIVTLLDAVDNESEALQGAREKIDLVNEANGAASRSTEVLATAFDNVASKTKDARDALRDLMKIEADRRAKLLADRSDAVALEEALQNARDAARDDVRKGPKGLDITTQAGRDNRTALDALAEQFNNSSSKVRNTEGRYERVRDELIKTAEKMGLTTKAAERLTDKLLDVPRLAPIEFQSRGAAKLIREAQETARALAVLVAASSAVQGDLANGRALSELGGLAPGRGSGATSSPRTATPSGPNSKGGATYNGAIINNGTINVTDDEQARRRLAQQQRRANSDGVRRR